MKPLISVIIPCYNAEQYVEEAVRSIMTQTYDDLEIICVNDASKDNTLQILNKLAAEDKRVMVVNNEVNLKLIGTLNKAIDIASGAFIARMDADDVSAPTRLEEQLRLMTDNPTIDVSGVLPLLLTNSSKVLGLAAEFRNTHPQSILFSALFSAPIAHPSIMIKAELMKQFRYEKNAETVHVEDYDLWLRLLTANKQFALVNKPLFYYRLNQFGVSINNRKEQAENHVNLSVKAVKNFLNIDIDPKSAGIIGRYYAADSPAELRNALASFKLVKTSFLKKYPELPQVAKAEINDWYQQRQIFILFNTAKKGALKTKITSLLALIQNAGVLFSKLTFANAKTRFNLLTLRA